jgi:hypothetical protein
MPQQPIPDHSQRVHGLISASKFERVEACPGSVTRYGKLEDRESEWAAEGTAAHEAIDHKLKTGEWPSDISQDLQVTLGYVVEWVLQNSKGGLLFSEVGLSHPIASWVTGTTDIIIQFSDRLVVFDFKFGAGVEVVAEENSQLGFYAALIDPHGYYDGRTTFVICQPRWGWFKPWNPSPTWSQQLRDRILATIAKVVAGDTTLKETDKGCRWCPAKLVCDLKQDRLRAVTLDAAFGSDKIFGLTDQQLADLYTRVAALDPFIKAVTNEARARAKAGRLPGYKATQGLGNRSWAFDEKVTAERLAASGAPVESLYEKSLVSPAKAEQLLGPSGKSLVAQLVTRSPSGNVTIVPESSPLPRADLNLTAADAFRLFGETQ